MIMKSRGPDVAYHVRYQGGRKQFAKLWGDDGAKAFANLQRESANGWAEITRVTTEMVERKS